VLIWSAASGTGALMVAYVFGSLRIRGKAAVGLLLARAKIKDATLKEMAIEEAAERTAFRTSLMSAVSDLRHAVHECEADRSLLHERLNSYNSELKFLQTECNIIKMQMKHLAGASGRIAGEP
jgi:hypothetical protein